MLVFLDIETTGFDPKKDAILEIAAVKWDGEKIVDRFETLLQIDEKVEISETVKSLTGISAEMCQEMGMQKNEAQKKLKNFFEESDIITGHNIQFDTGFLRAHGFEIPKREIDTFVLSTLVLGKQEESHALEILAEKYGILHESAHRAMSDVLANLGLYEFLQIFFAQNFSEELKKYAQNLHEKGIFDEYFFFAEVEKHQEKLQKMQLPTAQFSFRKKLNPQNTLQNLTDNAEFFSPIFSQIFSPQQSVFAEQMRYDDILVKALAEKNPIAFCYNPQKKMQFLDFFHALASFAQNEKIEKKIEFFVSSEKKIDTEKVEKMKRKEKFSREESVVLAKIFQAEKDEQLHLLHFGNQEWAVAREILGGKNEYEKAEIAFVPFSDWKNLPEKMTKIFLDADEIEDILTAEHTEKIFSKRTLEDFSTQEKTHTYDKVQTAIKNLADAIRAEKGENQYSMILPMKSLQAILTIKPFLDDILMAFETKNFSDFAPEQQELAEKWRKFFAEDEAENVMKTLEIFPDNAFAIQQTPKDLAPFAEEIFASPAVFVGKSFAKDFSRNPVFSFDLPENFAFFPEKKKLPCSILVPAVSKEISAEQASEILKKWLAEGENIVVSGTTRKTLENIVSFLRPFLEEKNISVFTQNSGSAGKTQMRLSQKGQKLVVGNAKYLEGLSLEDFDFDTMMVLKAAFDAPKNPLLAERRKKFLNDFSDFALPRAKAKFEREIFRLKNPKKLFFGDGRAAEKNSFFAPFFADLEGKVERISVA